VIPKGIYRLPLGETLWYVTVPPTGEDYYHVGWATLSMMSRWNQSFTHDSSRVTPHWCHHLFSIHNRLPALFVFSCSSVLLIIHNFSQFYTINSLPSLFPVLFRLPKIFRYVKFTVITWLSSDMSIRSNRKVCLLVCLLPS